MLKDKSIQKTTLLFGILLTGFIAGFVNVPAVFAEVAGADGKTFDQRRAEWLNRDGKLTGGYNFMSTHDAGARMHLFAWMENNSHQACRQNLSGLYNPSGASCYNDSVIGGEVCSDSNSIERMNIQGTYYYFDLNCVSGNLPNLNGGPDWYNTARWYTSGSHASLTLSRLYYQYGSRLSAADYDFIRRAMSGVASSENYFAGYPLKGDMQPQQWVVRFLYSLGDKNLRVKYCPEASPMCQAFTYRGKTYTPGVEYNSFELSRDALYLFFDDLRRPGYRYELDSMTYTSPAIESFMLLYDFSDRTGDSDGTIIKQKAKMTLDLLHADAVMEFSANQHGGVLGRSYRRDFVNGRDTYEWFYPWGLWYDRFGSAAFASNYRLADPIVDLGVINDESDNYWHESHERGGDSGQSNKFIFTTKNYNLGSSKSTSNSKGWVAHLLGNDTTWGQPFTFWINDVPGDLDEAACNDDECYTTGGAGAYQYHGAMLFNVASPILHLTHYGSNAFDEGEQNLVTHTGSVCRNAQRACNSDNDCNISIDPRDNCLQGPFKNDYRLVNGGWNYFKEGKTMVAINMNPSSSWHGLEFATEGMEYSDFNAFKSASRSLSDGRFMTGKGVVIEARNSETFVNGLQLWSGDFPRIEAIDSYGQKVISWNNNIMTVSKNGRTCTYDFNSWNYSGDCGDGGGGQPIPTPTPAIIQGDLDRDGDVDIFDYNILVRNFGNKDCGNQADIDGNCKVDIFDYNILVENFGKKQ